MKQEPIHIFFGVKRNLCGARSTRPRMNLSRCEEQVPCDTYPRATQLAVVGDADGKLVIGADVTMIGWSYTSHLAPEPIEHTSRGLYSDDEFCVECLMMYNFMIANNIDSTRKARRLMKEINR